MATALTGRTIAGSYKDLLQVYNGNQGIDSTLRRISDGEGTDGSALISTNKFQIRPASNGTDTFEVVNSSGSVIFQINTTSNKVVLPSGVTIEGDGSALTGVLSAGVGGASSTGNLEVQADSDSSGSGDIIFKIGTKEVARIPYSYASGLPTGVAGNYFIKAVADNWGQPFGGAKFDGVDDYYSVADNDNLDFGTGDFSVEFYIKHNNSIPAIAPQIVSKYQAGVAYWFTRVSNVTGVLEVVINNGTTSLQASSSKNMADGEWHHVICVFDRDNLLSLYVDGRLNGSVSISSFSAINMTNAGSLTIGRLSDTNSNYLFGSIGKVNIYNYALSQSLVTKHYDNGRPDLAELDYADKGASNTDLLSGWDFTSGWLGDATNTDADTLTFSASGSEYSSSAYTQVGKYYKLEIAGTSSGADVALQDGRGGAQTLGILSGTFDEVFYFNPSTTATTKHIFQFTASGATVLDITTFKLTRLGCVAEYKGDGFGAMGLIDSSGNGLHGTSAGNPIALSKKKDFYKTVSTTAVQLVNTQKAGTILKQVKIKNITGSALTASLSTLNTLIATTSANNTLLNAVSVGANETKIFNIGDSAYSYASALRSLYVISSVATSLEVTLIYEEIE